MAFKPNYNQQRSERNRVKELISVVVALQEELRKHQIEIPPHLNIPDVKRLEGD